MSSVPDLARYSLKYTLPTRDPEELAELNLLEIERGFPVTGPHDSDFPWLQDFYIKILDADDVSVGTIRMWTVQRYMIAHEFYGQT